MPVTCFTGIAVLLANAADKTCRAKLSLFKTS